VNLRAAACVAAVVVALTSSCGEPQPSPQVALAPCDILEEVDSAIAEGLPFWEFRDSVCERPSETRDAVAFVVDRAGDESFVGQFADNNYRKAITLEFCNGEFLLRADGLEPVERDSLTKYFQDDFPCP